MQPATPLKRICDWIRPPLPASSCPNCRLGYSPAQPADNHGIGRRRTPPKQRRLTAATPLGKFIGPQAGVKQVGIALLLVGAGDIFLQPAVRGARLALRRPRRKRLRS